MFDKLMIGPITVRIATTHCWSVPIAIFVYIGPAVAGAHVNVLHDGLNTVLSTGNGKRRKPSLIDSCSNRLPASISAGRWHKNTLLYTATRGRTGIVMAYLRLTVQWLTAHQRIKDHAVPRTITKYEILTVRTANNRCHMATSRSLQQ